MKYLKMKSTTAIFCPFCKSPFVEHETPEVTRNEDLHTELYHVECKNCGAIGNVRELWKLAKEKA